MASLLPRLLGLTLAGVAAVAALASLPRQAGSEAPAVLPDRSPRRPTRQATPAGAPRETRRVAVAPWGGALGSLGREIPQEGAPQGPMSFAVDAGGVIHALDTVNGRVTTLAEGKTSRAIPLPSDTIDDLDLLDDGGYLALDRHIARAVHVLSPEGKERGRIELRGAEIPEPGLVTALFARPDGVWVEVEHRRLVRVGDAAGLPVLERAVVAGRFAADGKGTLVASRLPPDRVRVLRLTPSLEGRPLAEPTFPLPVAMITALEGLPGGGAALAVILHRDSAAPPHATEEARHLLVGLGPGGDEQWRAELPPDEGPEENLRPVRLGRDGALYGMVFRGVGVEFWKVQP